MFDARLLHGCKRGQCHEMRMNARLVESRKHSPNVFKFEIQDGAQKAVDLPLDRSPTLQTPSWISKLKTLGKCFQNSTKRACIHMS